MTYPPRTAFDVLMYDEDDVCAGYRDYRPDLPTPGDNRPGGYRWGWANRAHDGALQPDGFEDVRREFIQMVRRPN